MLLVIDVGNTNTVLGVFARAGDDQNEPSRYDQLAANWRVATSRTSTVD
jgi:pantothenate kinase type III